MHGVKNPTLYENGTKHLLHMTVSKLTASLATSVLQTFTSKLVIYTQNASTSN